MIRLTGNILGLTCLKVHLHRVGRTKHDLNFFSLTDLTNHSTAFGIECMRSCKLAPVLNTPDHSELLLRLSRRCDIRNTDYSFRSGSSETAHTS